MGIVSKVTSLREMWSSR